MLVLILAHHKPGYTYGFVVVLGLYKGEGELHGLIFVHHVIFVDIRLLRGREARQNLVFAKDYTVI